MRRRAILAVSALLLMAAKPGDKNGPAAGSPSVPEPIVRPEGFVFGPVVFEPNTSPHFAKYGDKRVPFWTATEARRLGYDVQGIEGGLVGKMQTFEFTTDLPLDELGLSHQQQVRVWRALRRGALEQALPANRILNRHAVSTIELALYRHLAEKTDLEIVLTGGDGARHGVEGNRIYFHVDWNGWLRQMRRAAIKESDLAYLATDAGNVWKQLESHPVFATLPVWQPWADHYVTTLGFQPLAGHVLAGDVLAEHYPSFEFAEGTPSEQLQRAMAVAVARPEYPYHGVSDPNGAAEFNRRLSRARWTPVGPAQSMRELIALEELARKHPNKPLEKLGHRQLRQAWRASRKLANQPSVSQMLLSSLRRLFL